MSVIICARDEAANLAKYLPGALVQKYNTTHEVIVINDNSFDESKYILEEYQRTFKHLQLVELKQEARFIPGKKFPGLQAEQLPPQVQPVLQLITWCRDSMNLN